MIEDNPTKTPVAAGQAPERALPRIAYHRPRIGPAVQFREVAGWEWNQVELSLPSLPPGMHGTRILHLSDLHLRHRWPKHLDEVIERVNANPPELILFTGDFVDDKYDHRAGLLLAQRLISRLQSRHGMFSIVGNHDTDLLAPHLIRFGVPVIVHQRLVVPVTGGQIELIGLPGPERGDLDERFLHALPPKDPAIPRIVLCHYPDLIRPTLAAGAAPDLYLAGHTHGGQICPPNERPIMRHDTLPHRLCKGAHDVEGTCLIVSRGFGFTTLPVRIFCPAEVVEVRLKTMLNAE